MIRVKIIETEDVESMLQAIKDIAEWLHDFCKNENFCQNQNEYCYQCNIKSLCEESFELRDWASLSQVRYKDLINN